jgi:hypothetical protein
MNTYRKTAVIVGVLFIIATAFLFIGRSVYEPILNSPDSLTNAYPNRVTATVGMLLEFACVLAIPLIPVFLYPVLRGHSQSLALGYIVFRAIEAILFVVTEINLLLLIHVSQGYLSQGGMESTYFQNLGSAIVSWNGWAFSFYLFFFTSGALLLNAALYQSRLVPRFIAVWGFLAAALLLTGTVLQMLEVQVVPQSVFELVFAVPIAVNEMVLAGWLIVKGFNPAAIVSAPAAGETQKRFAPGAVAR